jgi:hypothetical protein
MPDSNLDNLLSQEYLHLQSVIEAFDSKALTIKAWSVTFSLAAIGSAYAVKAPAILAVASFSALLFWLLEGYWKTFQDAHYQRNKELENHFNVTALLNSPMQIASVWYKEWSSGGSKRLLRIMIWLHVALPHLAIVFLGLILLILHCCGVVTVN